MQGTVITNKGLQLIAKLVASGTVLSFTRAAVGTGSVPSGYDPTNMTGLNKYKMDGAIASCSSSGDTASIIFQVSSIGVSAGFTITEAGLFATDPDEGEILYCYLDMSTDPQYIYAEGSAISKFVEMTLTVVVGSVQSVTAYINPGSLLTNDGDISNTTIETLDNITESFPVPVAKEKSSKFFGKIKKSLEDWKNLKTSLLLVGSIINNCVTDNANLPLSAAQGKALMDLYIALNSDLGNIGTNLSDVSTELAATNTDLDPLKSNRVSHINSNVLNKVNIVLWDADTADTPFKAGNTNRGNGFCITYSSGEPYSCQLAMAVGDSHLFTRNSSPDGWSGWTTK